MSTQQQQQMKLDVAQLIAYAENTEFYTREGAYNFAEHVAIEVKDIYNLLMELSELEIPAVDAVMERVGLVL